MKHALSILPLMMFATLCCGISACKDGDVVERHYSSVKVDTCRVAIVLPLSEDAAYKERFEQTAQWAQQLFATAGIEAAVANGDSTSVALAFEWYDEDTENLTTLASHLAAREDVKMVIGPMRSSNVELMATSFARYNKPLISPSASSEDIIRRYSVGAAGVSQRTPFLWTLTETDVSQCEALLSKAWGSGARSICLLVPDDVYGKTFHDWIPFVAIELGLSVSTILEYTSDGELESHARAALSSGADCAICVTQTLQQTHAVLQIRQELGDACPRLLFSDAALSASLITLGDLAEGIEGVAQYADPTTGFQVAYEMHFGRNLAGVEAQLYDAVLLAGFAATVAQATGQSDYNEILRNMTASGSDDAHVWSELDMALQILRLRSGGNARMIGASGMLRFDNEAYTSLISSAYVHWTIYDGAIVPIDYMSTDGGYRTEATLASWNWQARKQITIPDQGTSTQYLPIQSQWAVLIQGSQDWRNYRHQADVLNVYQLLKTNGFPDDHIILIISDDLAHSDRNAWPGEVRSSTDGANLYNNVEIDYRSGDLTPDDICSILLGNSSDRLPVVLPADATANVLLFWSGHGSKSSAFNWLADNLFTANQLRTTLESMTFRKMLMLFEPCYSQNMLEQAEGIPGVLAMSSAASNEQSFADCYSLDLGTYLSDRFSNNLVGFLSSNPADSYKNLYTYLVTHTLGSHVQVSNGALFDNLCIATPEEFIIYQSK
ncbi:MAG: ABC transporter substrate-binding protein [Bacteroidales bacterium]|nr:ABC transporter substrate-binding protein [Bacteroidales bacterium]